MLIAQHVWHAKTRHTRALVQTVLTARHRMSSMQTGQRALHVVLAPVPTAIERNVSAALGRPSQRSASAKTAPLRTSSTMLTRRARRALLVRNRMLIAQRVWHAKALLTPASAPIALTVVRQMSSTARGRPAPHVLQAPVPTPIERSVSAALGRPSQPSASAKTAPLRTSSMMLTRRARHALLGRRRIQIAVCGMRRRCLLQLWL